MKKIIFKNDYTNVVFQCKENKIFIESIAFSGKEYIIKKECNIATFSFWGNIIREVKCLIDMNSAVKTCFL